MINEFRFRVGVGQDSHKLMKNTVGNKKTLILGGEKVSGEYYLEANSDGDVVLHALINALSSAVGGGSVSNYADPLYKKGILDSKEYVKEVLKKMDGYKVNNVSVAIEGVKPKLEVYFEQTKTSIAKILDISKEQVGLTVTSGEGLNSFGKGEGIQAIVIVSLVYYE